MGVTNFDTVEASAQTLTGQQTIKTGDGVIATDGAAYSGTGSYQPVGPDLNLAAGAGGTTGKFLAGVMGHLIGPGSALTKAGNYLAGVIGKYTTAGAGASTYPKAGVLGLVGAGTTDADACVVAAIDGDEAAATPRAMFAVDKLNSNPNSNPQYGLDLQMAAHDSYQVLAYSKAPLRLGSDVCVLTGAGAPTSGGAGTGLNFAGKGSLYVDATNGKLYINTNTTASPTWTVVGSQS